MAYKELILGLLVLKVNLIALITKAEPKRIYPCFDKWMLIYLKI